MTDYKFKTKPFQHQRDAWEVSKDATGYALFMEMGTGKTKVALDTAAYLYDTGKIGALLVFGNKGSYANWITKEIPIHMPDHISTNCVLWTGMSSKKKTAEYMTLFQPTLHLQVLVMNIEALAFDSGVKMAERFASCHNAMCVVDESTTIKNPKAARTKAIMRLRDLCKYRRVMTGSPVTNSPLDLWSQINFIGQNFLRFSSFFAFRARYANMITMQNSQRSYQKIVSYRNLDELNDKIKAYSFLVKKEDCLDLPAKIYQRWDVELTEEQQKLYKSLKEQAIAELGGESVVAAPLVITRLLRLHQLTCGHLTDTDGKVHPVKNNRMAALLDILEETQGKVLIWAVYRADIQAIEKTLKETYGPESTVSYYGDTDNADREAAVEGIQSGDTRFFVGNPRTGGYGITLTAATTVIYYSNTYQYEVRIQSEDRAHRIGQTKSVTYIDLVSPGTIDEKILKALSQKHSIAEEITAGGWQDLF
jgi:SNF2 family DNA or RNA helicase